MVTRDQLLFRLGCCSFSGNPCHRFSSMTRTVSKYVPGRFSIVFRLMELNVCISSSTRKLLRGVFLRWLLVLSVVVIVHATQTYGTCRAKYLGGKERRHVATMLVCCSRAHARNSRSRYLCKTLVCSLKKTHLLTSLHGPPRLSHTVDLSQAILLPSVVDIREVDILAKF